MQVNCTTQVLLDSNYRPFHGIVIIFQNTLVQKMDLYISYSHTPLSIDFVVVTCKLDLETFLGKLWPFSSGQTLYFMLQTSMAIPWKNTLS